MTIGHGDRVPDVPLMRMGASGPEPVTRNGLFAGRTVALFAVPGAFTPTCSDRHLPSVIANAPAMLAAGADRVACLSVNDIFVMAAWGRALGVDEDVLMLADGSALWTRSAGLDWDLGAMGLGIRSQRYGMIVDDARVRHIAVEPGGAFGASSGEAILAVLRGS